MNLSFPNPRCIFDFSIVLNVLVSLNVLVYAFKSEVQIKKDKPLIIFADHYNDSRTDTERIWCFS